MERVSCLTIGINGCKRIPMIDKKKKGRLNKKLLDFIRGGIKAGIVDKEMIRYRKV